MSDHLEQQIVILTTIWWWQKLGRDQQVINKDHRDFIYGEVQAQEIR
jgi:hypothetical protein